MSGWWEFASLACLDLATLWLLRESSTVDLLGLDVITLARSLPSVRFTRDHNSHGIIGTVRTGRGTVTTCTTRGNGATPRVRGCRCEVGFSVTGIIDVAPPVHSYGVMPFQVACRSSTKGLRAVRCRVVNIYHGARR